VNVRRFKEMTELSTSLRQKLAEQATLSILEPLEERISADAQTRKILFRLDDKNTIESGSDAF